MTTSGRHLQQQGGTVQNRSEQKTAFAKFGRKQLAKNNYGHLTVTVCGTPLLVISHVPGNKIQKITFSCNDKLHCVHSK